MPKFKLSPLDCAHANECPAECPCLSSCYCKKHTCKPVKKPKSKSKKFTVKVRVYMAAYADEKSKQGVELTLNFPHEPKREFDWIEIWRQIQEEAEKCLAVRVKYPGKDWEPFGGKKK